MGDEYQYNSESTQSTGNTDQTQAGFAPPAQETMPAPDGQPGGQSSSSSWRAGTNPAWSPQQQLMAAKLGIDLKNPATSGQNSNMFKGVYGTAESPTLNLNSQEGGGVGGYLKYAGDAVTGTLKQAGDGISSYYQHVGENASRAMQANVYGARNPEQLAEAMKTPSREPQAESSSPRHYPKPIFDSPGWTEGEREVNSRLQHAFRGHFADALAPSMSERFKPGFDPNSIPPSDNPFSAPGTTKILSAAGLEPLIPFAKMANAEDFMEQAMGKQIWPRQNPEIRDDWWIKNTD